MLFNGHCWHPGVLAFCIYLFFFLIQCYLYYLNDLFLQLLKWWLWFEWKVFGNPFWVGDIKLMLKSAEDWVPASGISQDSLGLFSDFSSKSFPSLLLNIYFFVLQFRVEQRELRAKLSKGALAHLFPCSTAGRKQEHQMPEELPSGWQRWSQRAEVMFLRAHLAHWTI